MALVNTAKAARELGVSVQHLRRLVREGLVPAIRLGASVRFDPTALQKWVMQGGKVWPGRERYHPPATQRRARRAPSASLRRRP
jgi:excisionase family DNA binding protein